MAKGWNLPKAAEAESAGGLRTLQSTLSFVFRASPPLIEMFICEVEVYYSRPLPSLECVLSFLALLGLLHYELIAQVF